MYTVRMRKRKALIITEPPKAVAVNEGCSDYAVCITRTVEAIGYEEPHRPFEDKVGRGPYKSRLLLFKLL